MTVQSRVWFNEDLESRNFIIPGVVAVIMALVGAQLTSLTISREWERGTMELLISTPVKPSEVMIGKLVPYFVIGWIDAALLPRPRGVVVRGAVPRHHFHLVRHHDAVLIVVLGIGYLLSVLIRSQIGASQIALLLTMLPTTLLSGYVFPIDQMPTRRAGHHLSRLLPATTSPSSSRSSSRAPIFPHWRRRSCFSCVYAVGRDGAGRPRLP